MPRANLLYSPRNKILATSLLTEAILYEEQTRRGVRFAHYDEYADVADHCTVCHKCEPACPVDIDFGDVSIIMRNHLRRSGKRRFNPGTRAAMLFLEPHRSARSEVRPQPVHRLGLPGAAHRLPLLKPLAKGKPANRRSPPAASRRCARR